MLGRSRRSLASRDELASRDAARTAQVVGPPRLRSRSRIPQQVRGRRRTPRRPAHAHDLARFPFTTKQDLRDAYPFGGFAVPRTDVVRVHASSGTTGQPTVVGYTARDIDVWASLMARSMRAAGARPGDIVHVAYGYGLFTGGLGAHYGAEKLGCTVVPMSGGQTEKQVQLIMDFRPDVIMVTPSYMLNLCEEFVRQGIDPRIELAQNRHLRRRALDRVDAEHHRTDAGHRCDRPVRALGGHRSRSGVRVRRSQGRGRDLGGSLLSGDRRPRHGRGASPTATSGSLSSRR